MLISKWGSSQNSDLNQCFSKKVKTFWLPKKFEWNWHTYAGLFAWKFPIFVSLPSQIRNRITHKFCYDNFCRPIIVAVTSLKGILNYSLTKQYIIKRYDCPYISTPIHEIWVFVSSDWLFILFSKWLFCKTLLFTESRTTYMYFWPRSILIGLWAWNSKVLFFLSYDQKLNVKLYLLIWTEMKTKSHFMTNRPHFIANFVGNAVA